MVACDGFPIFVTESSVVTGLSTDIGIATRRGGGYGARASPLLKIDIL